VNAGGTKPTWTEAFETSHDREFDDAVKEHRMDITPNLLPNFGIRLA
jgi:hypothetical protein